MAGFFFSGGDFPEVALGKAGLSQRLLGFGGGLMLTEMAFDAGTSSESHAHDAEQLTYCRSGEFECSVGGESRTLRPGDSFYAGPGVLHGAACLKAGSLLHAFTPQREEYKPR